MSQPIEWQHVTGAWKITDYDSRDDADALPEQMPLKGTVTFRASFDSHDRFAAINVPDPAGSYLLSMSEMVYPVVRGRLQDRQARDGVMLPATAGGVPIVWEAIPHLETDPGVFTKGSAVRADTVKFLPPDKDGNGERHINLSDVFDTTISLPPIVESRVAELVRVATEQATASAGSATAAGLSELAAAGSAELAEQYAQQTAEMIPPATDSAFGKIKLRGDLGGTAEDPTVPALAQKADLDGSGKIPQAQLPAIAVTEFLGNVASQTAMLALDGQRGDWCNRTDLGTEWQLVAEPSTSLSSWQQKVYPASEVTSVAGRKGAVTLSSTDITDTTAVGQNLMKAANAAVARSAIGAISSATVDGKLDKLGDAAGLWVGTSAALPGTGTFGVVYVVM
ncbi:hypothetical protein GS876_10230 [Rhodococcus hoagii]|nr:hypothetical protein [Prescottella equi]NKT72888.1 hypothetical protein [Prescottella equi]NKT75912.1 hypothetical protein [Prescottella equi]NKU49688.1 hypothetical protein [Prescottella equi]NKU90818.1 hypothetical protein [Prescottella equi]